MIKLCESTDEIIQIAKIHTDNRKTTYVGILEQSWLDSLNYEDANVFWKKWCKKGDREVLLYMLNNEVVGFAGIKYYETEVCGAILSFLHVRADAQHKGIGKALISASAGLLYNMGIEGMYIEVIDGNTRAESLYKSYGAEYVEELSHDYHKKYIWKDIKSIADQSVLPRMGYDYTELPSALENGFVLFGAGEYGDVFRKHFPGDKPLKIFDNDIKKHGTIKNDCRIEMPRQAETVIIASCYYDEIEQQLRRLKCNNIIRFYPWHDYNKG